MTYRELAEYLSSLDGQQLDLDIKIYDEYDDSFVDIKSTAELFGGNIEKYPVLVRD